MKIKFITEEGLLAVKNNFQNVYKEIISKKNATLPTLFQDDKIIRESSIEVEDFTFDMSKENPVSTDVENIRRVYGHMKGMSESQASDERIWAAFTLSEGIDYMRYRWIPKENETPYERYLFKQSGENQSKRPLFRNGIARLWWIGYHTFDSRRQNPYELTEFVCRDQDYINNLLDIGYASNPTISKAVLTALLDAEQNGVVVNRTLVRNISRYVNLLGGVYMIDCFSYDEMYSKIKEKIGF